MANLAGPIVVLFLPSDPISTANAISQLPTITRGIGGELIVIGETRDAQIHLHAGASDVIDPATDIQVITARCTAILRHHQSLWMLNKQASDLGIETLSEPSAFFRRSQKIHVITEHRPANLFQALDNIKPGIRVEHSKTLDDTMVPASLNIFDVDRQNTGALRALRSRMNTRIQKFVPLTSDRFSPRLMTAFDLGFLGPLIVSDPPELTQTKIERMLDQLNIEDALQQNIDSHVTASIKDPLTNAFNRRFMDSQLSKMVKHAAIHATPLSAVLLDIDYFKLINDTYGHLVGDEILKSLADRLVRNMRTDQFLIRMGGEEFLILMPNTASDTAAIVANRLRSAVSGTPFFPSSANEPIEMTVSIGIATTPVHPQRKGAYRTPSDQEMTITTLLGKADQALYKAKTNGRNRVQITRNAA